MMREDHAGTVLCNFAKDLECRCVVHRMGTGSVKTYKYYRFVALASGVARQWSVAKIGAGRDHARPGNDFPQNAALSGESKSQVILD